MKLMLQEASSVIKAIEKVWENSGKPQEFSIKILEFGEKNFLGMTKKSAVVSISYDPKKQPKLEEKEENRIKEVIQRKERTTELRPVGQQVNKEYRREDKRDLQIAAWSDEYIKDISSWISDILKIMHIDLSFNVKIENKILKILIDKRVLKEDEEEKLFFISLSHLLMQFLKKKYKKKLKNYYLIIHSKTSNSNGAK
ncbi:MAG: hypothetical protein WC436_00945 [Candidatus Babeliales bacterium]